MSSRISFLILRLNFFVAELVLTLVSFFRSLGSLSGVAGGRWVAYSMNRYFSYQAEILEKGYPT